MPPPIDRFFACVFTEGTVKAVDTRGRDNIEYYFWLREGLLRYALIQFADGFRFCVRHKLFASNIEMRKQ